MSKQQVLQRENVEDILSLTPTQEGMLFHYLMDDKSEQYKVSLKLVLNGTIDFELMKRAWKEVFNHNEALRSIYKWEKISKPVQIILKEIEIPIFEYDFREYSLEDKKAKLEELIQKNINENIDISLNPINITLCRTEDDRCTMIVTNHHILFDGWSNGIIYKNFLETYNNLINNKPINIKEKSKYKQFIKYILGIDIKKHNLFWNNYLDGLEEKTVLPYKNSNCTLTPSKIATIDYCLSKDITDDLNSFIRKNNITLAATIYCAWGILLKSYSNSDDVLFGTTVSGRTLAIKNIEDIVGTFINTIPFRVAFKKEDTILELINKILDDLIKRKEYENSSLSNIIEERKMGNINELFDSIVVIENYPFENISDETALSNLKIESYSIKEANNFNLTLTVMIGDVLKFNFAYNQELFDSKIIDNLSKNFVRIISLIINDFDKKVRELEILCPDEKEEIINSFNNTDFEYDSTKTLKELFEEQVHNTPLETAIVCGNEKINYSDLNQKANCLAHWLKNKGVKKGDIIGIALNRSIEVFIAMLGVVKASASYLPIDPEYPNERIEYILEHSNCFSVIAKKDSKFKTDDMICLDDLEIFESEMANLDNINSSDDLLYMIYTSGSTGKPKGVMISHKSVHNFINGMNRKLDFSQDKTIVSVTTISFDIFVLESWLALVNGLKIVLATEAEQNDPQLLDKLIIDNNVDIIQTTPSRLGLMIESKNIKGLGKLSKVLVGGEPFPEQLLFQLKEICKDGKIYNMYGPTETTVWSCVEELSSAQNITIGKAIDNTQLYVLDSNLKLLPIGAVGELYIGGDGLSLGYFKNEELSNQRFITSPFDEDKKIYKTGDLVKWLPDGKLKFIGRNDTQIKLRGYRIELSEIESQILKIPGVTQAIAVIKKNTKNEDSICAFVVSDCSYSHKDLVDILSKTLPTYMVPSYFVMLEKMFVLPNGKVDKKALLNYELKGCLENEKSYVPPKGELQNQLTEIWSEVLDIDKNTIGIDDRFFDIGGNSLNLVRLHLKINKLFPDKFNAADLFTYNTINLMADFINS